MTSTSQHHVKKLKGLHTAQRVTVLFIHLGPTLNTRKGSKKSQWQGEDMRNVSVNGYLCADLTVSTP